MAHEILDLNTLVDRRKVRIVSKLHPDGEMYDLLNPDELGVMDHQRLATRHGQVQKLQSKGLDKLSGKDARELSAALNDFVAIVMPGVEPAVLKELNDGQKTAILQSFENLIPDPEPGAGPTTPPTGGG